MRRLPRFIKRTAWWQRGLLLLLIGAIALAAQRGVFASLFGGSGGVSQSNSSTLNKGLVGWWKMDGNAKDATPNSRHGTLTGTTPPALTTDRKGVANSAYSFDGTSSYITTQPISLAKFSISVWIKPNGIQTEGASVVADAYPDKVNYAIYFAPNSLTLGAGIYSGGWTYTPTTTLTDGVWSYITFTYDGANMSLYVNGSLIGSPTAYVATPSSSGTQFRIGRRWDNPNYFKGSIDDVRVYNRGLSAAEITALYNTYGTGIQISDTQKGLLAWWKLDGNAKDSSPNSLNGTVSGATPTTDRAGQSTKAYSFNGTNSWVDLGNSSNVQLSTGTVSGWVKASAPGASYRGIVVKQSAYGMFLNNGVFVVHDWSVSGDRTTGINIADGNWHHVAFSFQSGVTNGTVLYIDGTARLTTTYTVLNQTVGLSLGAGTNPGGASQNINGSIDDVRLYGRVLSVSEIQRLADSYDAQPTISDLQKGLVGNWDMNGNTKDKTPYSNHGTVSGTSFVTDRKGQTNSSISFNGTSDYVYAKIGNGTYFGANNPLSVSAWVYATSTSNGPIFGVTSDPPGFSWNMPFLSINGTTVYGWIYNLAQISTTVSANNWHLLSLTYDPGGAGTTTFYVDGQSAGTTTGQYTSSGATDYFTTFIGGVKPAGVNSYLNTPIDDIRAYNRVLSQPEVQRLYDSY